MSVCGCSIEFSLHPVGEFVPRRAIGIAMEDIEENPLKS